MNLLEKEIAVKGYLLSQIKRNEKIAIYKQIDKDTKELVGFEVIVIQHQKEMDVKLGGNIIHYEEGEKYPASEKWGTFGFTFGVTQGEESALERASEKFDELTEHFKPKK